MVKVQDGLNSMPWTPLGRLPNGWIVELAPIPPRDKFKYGYDLWSNGLAFEAFGIGRTSKATIRAPGYGDGIWLFNFDTQGRLINASYTGARWGAFEIPLPELKPGFGLLPYPRYRPEIHRVIGGTWLRAKWTDTFDRSHLVYRAEIVSGHDPFYQAAMEVLDAFVDVLNSGAIAETNPGAIALVRTLRELPVKRHEELLKEAERFHALLGIRGQIPVEPPELAFDHYHAIPVKVQDGCGGPCTFCSLYERKIRVLPRESVYRQIDLMAEYLDEELDHFVKVVLLDGDALTVPTDQLAMELEYARERFQLGRAPFAHAFAKARTVAEKTVDELSQLRAAGLLNVNMGLESGCQALLDLVKPGQKLDDVREAVRKLYEAGLSVSLNVIGGLGGKQFHACHVGETIDFIRSLPRGIKVFDSALMVERTARYAKQEAQLGGMTDAAIQDQCAIFERELDAHQYLFVPV